MKEKWSVANDPEWKVWLLASLFFLSWFLCLFSFPLTIGYTDGTEQTIGYDGWGNRLLPKIIKLLP